MCREASWIEPRLFQITPPTGAASLRFDPGAAAHEPNKQWEAESAPASQDLRGNQRSEWKTNVCSDY